ncbi:MAG: hypothetical protein ACTSQP_21095 [Promethearchaeota archaeon]
MKSLRSKVIYINNSNSKNKAADELLYYLGLIFRIIGSVGIFFSFLLGVFMLDFKERAVLFWNFYLISLILYISGFLIFQYLKNKNKLIKIEKDFYQEVDENEIKREIIKEHSKGLIKLHFFNFLFICYTIMIFLYN